MPRNRLLKREFFRDEKVASVPLGARLLFQSMWCEADDSGNGRADARLLKAEAFPYDEFTAEQVEGWLQDLVKLKMVRLYKANGGRYFNVVNFLNHQTIDRPSKFRHPAPPLIDEWSSKDSRALDECSPTKEKVKVKGNGNGNENGEFGSADALPATDRKDFENLKTPKKDLRFEVVKSFYVAEFEKSTPGAKAPFDGGDGTALKRLLTQQAQASEETIIGWLRNAFDSGDVPPLRPGFRLREFCSHATKYTAGPLAKARVADRAPLIDSGDPERFSEVSL